MLWYGYLALPRLFEESKLLWGNATHKYEVYVYVYDAL